MRFLTLTVFGFMMSSLFSSAVMANTKQLKFYKEAFPAAEKPKCIACHAVDKPKKEGNHELNEYGKKVKAISETPTAEDYKKAGQIPA